jgi:hypothetical protein
VTNTREKHSLMAMLLAQTQMLLNSSSSTCVCRSTKERRTQALHEHVHSVFNNRQAVFEVAMLDALKLFQLRPLPPSFFSRLSYHNVVPQFHPGLSLSSQMAPAVGEMVVRFLKYVESNNSRAACGSLMTKKRARVAVFKSCHCRAHESNRPTRYK